MDGGLTPAIHPYDSNTVIRHQTVSPEAGTTAWCGTDRPPGISLTVQKRVATMLTAIVVPADPEQPVRLEHLEKNDVDAYRRLVGGYLEVINLDRPRASLYFNEEGKLQDLRPNPRATALMWVHNSAFRGRDSIVGDAFILGPPDRQADDTTAPEELVELLTKPGKFRYQVQTDGKPAWNGNDVVFGYWCDAYVAGLDLAGRWSLVNEVRIVRELDDELRERWYAIGKANPWIKEAEDPPFTRDSFFGCYSLEELEERISFGNWSLGTAFYYRDLCFINQINGGDEWLTIRHGVPFESITFRRFIERGDFPRLIRRLLAATLEQCQQLTY